MIYYKDEQITIRNIIEQDIVKLFSWSIDEQFNAFDPRVLPNDCSSLIKECGNYCQRFKNEVFNPKPELNKYRYFIITDSKNIPIGFINLFDFNKELQEAELGILLENNYWRKGIAFKSCKVVIAYAFKELNLKRIHIDTGEANLPSQALFEKLGFKRCGDYLDEGFKFIVMEYLRAASSL